MSSPIQQAGGPLFHASETLENSAPELQNPIVDNDETQDSSKIQQVFNEVIVVPDDAATRSADYHWEVESSGSLSS